MANKVYIEVACAPAAFRLAMSLACAPDWRAVMCLLEQRVLETLGVVNCVEVDAPELCSELCRQHLPEESPRQQFSDAPVSLPPSQRSEQISAKADRQQLTVPEVLSCAIEERLGSRGTDL